MREFKKLITPLFIMIAMSLILIYLDGYKKNVLAGIFTLWGGLYIKDNANKFYSQLKVLFGQHSWKRSQRELEVAGKLQGDTLIRISFAYLFRIKIDDKYFLVPNSRTGKYQPVGGAYKFGKNEAKYLVSNFSAKDDNRIKVNEVTEADYRLLVKNKNLRGFVKRFDNALDRENIDNLSREFIEEIFNTDILEREDFGDLAYSYCGRHMSNIEKKAFGLYELLLADIIEIDLAHNQKELFKRLMVVDSKKYRFATSEEINNFGIDYASQNLTDTIANHTPKILNENNDQLFKKIKYKYKYNSIITISL